MVLSASGLFIGFTVTVLLLCSPLLAIERLRALFEWPTRWLVVNYLFLGAVLLAIQALSYLVIILLTAGMGSVTGTDAVNIVGGVILANIAIPGVGALTALRFLPARGYWSPDGEGLNGRFALGIGVIWYAVVTSVGFVFAGLALMFANLPM